MRLRTLVLGSLFTVIVSMTCSYGVDASDKQFSLRHALSLMPEYNGVKVHPTELKQYETAISNLDIDAQRWLCSSGLFLEDGEIDWVERFILKKLKGKKYQLWYLTSPRMLDGAGIWDALYAWLWNYRKSPVKKLSEEMDDLASQKDSLVGTNSTKAFRELITKAQKDYQLRLGLALISNYGLVRSDRFAYKTPTFNTQLAILGALLNDQWESGTEHLLLAASLLYGSLYTASDAKLQAQLPKYCASVLKYLWAKKDIHSTLTQGSIPALSYLVWTAPSMTYPTYFKRDDIKSDAWYPRLRRKPMTSKQFEWIFPSVELLNKIHDGFSGGEYELESLHKTIKFVSDKEAASWTEVYHGERFRGSHVINPEYYWERWSQGITTAGDDTDRSLTEVLVARAVGMPAITGRMVIDQGWEQRDFTAIYDRDTDRFRAYWDDVEQRRKNRGVERIQVAFQKLPWDNFRYDWPDMMSVTRIANYDTSEARVLAVGIPSGYLLRGRNPQISLAYEGVLTPEQQTQYNMDKGQ